MPYDSGKVSRGITIFALWFYLDVLTNSTPHHNICILIFACCAHRSEFHRNLCIVILSCCAHKSDFHHNLCIVIFSCCAHKFDFRHNAYILILSCYAYKSGEETIPLVQDEDYHNYGTPNTSMVDETSFVEPDTTEATSTLSLNQKVKWGKLAALYRHLNIIGNIDLIELDRFKLTRDPKKGAIIFEFYNDDR